MPVVRNPQFYFREGFCWSAINGTRSTNDLKFRYKGKSITDVQGMSLYSVCNKISSKFITCIGNSKYINQISELFINSTVIFQINDCRLIPIIIPNSNQLCNFEKLFDKAYAIKIMQFENKISEIEADKQIKILQIQLENLVDDLYQINS